MYYIYMFSFSNIYYFLYEHVSLVWEYIVWVHTLKGKKVSGSLELELEMAIMCWDLSAREASTH